MNGMNGAKLIHCRQWTTTKRHDEQKSPRLPKIATQALFIILLCSRLLNAESVETVAGTGKKGFAGESGPAKQAELNNPYALGRGPDGQLYFCDVDNHRIRRIDLEGKIHTVVGCGEQGYDGNGGLAVDAKLNLPYEIAWDATGNLYFVDMGNHCIRRVDEKSKVITTIAGTGVAGFSGDGGPAIHAQLHQPHSIAIGPGGDLFVCDILNHRIRRVDLKNGTIETFSGDGRRDTSPDGTPIAQAALHGPRALAFDKNGNGWLALREGNSLLQLDLKANRIQRVAGTGRAGFSGNGGPALEATLSGPKGVAIDHRGNILLADTESHSIRFYNPSTQKIELLVGDGTRGDGPDGAAPQNCRLARPHGVYADPSGSVWIGDSENHRIRVWHP